MLYLQLISEPAQKWDNAILKDLKFFWSELSFTIIPSAKNDEMYIMYIFINIC